MCTTQTHTERTHPGAGSPSQELSTSASVAAVAAGGALLISGAALLVADRLKSRRGGERKTTWQPMLTPRTAGLAVSGRF